MAGRVFYASSRVHIITQLEQAFGQHLFHRATAIEMTEKVKI